MRIRENSEVAVKEERSCVSVCVGWRRCSGGGKGERRGEEVSQSMRMNKWWNENKIKKI